MRDFQNRIDLLPVVGKRQAVVTVFAIRGMPRSRGIGELSESRGYLCKSLANQFVYGLFTGPRADLLLLYSDRWHLSGIPRGTRVLCHHITASFPAATDLIAAERSGSGSSADGVAMSEALAP